LGIFPKPSYNRWHVKAWCLSNKEKAGGLKNGTTDNIKKIISGLGIFESPPKQGRLSGKMGRQKERDKSIHH